MRKKILIGGLSALALMVVVAGIGPAEAQQTSGSGTMGPGMMGMMGPGMMGGYGMMGSGMMGPGMMGPGMMNMMGPGMMNSGMMGMMGPGMMGCGYGQQQATLNLSTGDVKSHLERYVAMMGNPHLKAGSVAEKDANTIIASIVTTEKDALVQRFNVDRHTGIWQSVQ